MTNPLQGLLRRSTLLGGATARNRLYGWAGAALCIIAANSAQALDANYVGFSYSTAAQAGKTCLQIDSLVTLNSANITAREALVSACTSETRPLSTGGERRDYRYSDNGGAPYYFGPYYYNYPSKGGGPAVISEANAISGCQNSRAAYIAALDQSLRTNHFVCWNPPAYVNVSVVKTAPAADPNAYAADLSTLSGKTSLAGNWVRASAVINNDLASAVLTKIDWKPKAAPTVCMDANGAGSAVTQTCNTNPNWLSEPTATVNVFRLRRTQSTGQCLEFDTATNSAKLQNCRARNDALYTNQTWQLISASGGNKLIQSKASAQLCLTYSNGNVVAQACPADIATATPQQLWQMAQPVYGHELWKPVTEFVYYNASRRVYSFIDAVVQPPNSTPDSSAPAGFVVLSEPTASTMPVYRDTYNNLYLCNDDNVACGEIAFYTVLPPAITTTPSATDAARLPVYAFISPRGIYSGTRYSTSLDLGTDWVRQPGIVFYAYQNLNDTENRITEVLAAVQRVFLGYNAGAQPAQQITVPNLVSIASGNVSYQYAAGSPGQFTVISNTAQRPDREELLHVAGHLVVDSILGPMLDIDRCDYTVDSAAGASDFHRPRDILAAGSQSEACSFREGWAEFFTSQMLVGKTSLANFANTGGVLFDSDHVGQSSGRRQLNPVLLGFVALAATPEAAPFYVAAFAINWFFLERNFAPNPVFETIGQQATIPLPKADTERTVRDDLRQELSSSLAQSAYSDCLVAQGRYADSNATACDFSAYVNDDPLSLCEVIDPSNHLQKENCHNTHRILCTNGSTITATPLAYPLYQAPLACTTLGPTYIPSAGTNSSGAIVGDGKAEEPPTKRVRLIAGPPDPEAVAFVEAKVKPAIADPRFAFLLVHSLNVGSGSCHIVECVAPPSTPESVIVDCGSNSSQGDHVLKQVEIDAYLEDLRLFADPAKYPALVVTHPDKDHYKYAADIFINRKPSRVWLGGYPGSYKIGFPEWINTFFNQPGNTVQVNGATSSVPPAARWAALPTPAGYAQAATIKTFAACGGATLKMVTVNNGNGGAADNNRNVNSAVLKVEWGNRFVAVISGDATGATETAASLALDGSVAVPRPALTHDLMRLLVVSHHGADTEGSSSVAWIQRINPTHAVYSAGSKFGHPRCTIFDRMDLTALVLGSDQVHDLACGVDTNNANRQLRQPVKNQFSTRESGTVVGGVAIPIGTNNNLPPYAIFKTDPPH